MSIGSIVGVAFITAVITIAILRIIGLLARLCRAVEKLASGDK